ncbi:MAG: MBOAT family protein [Nitrospiraceae bacterium]|nr:MAG: MBOAT family protein [Nitrospiraceae bacterium]
MSFNSFEFILLFLPITLIIYFYLNHRKLIVAGRLWLMFISLLFYSFWSFQYVPLILMSVLINYGLGIAIASCLHELFKKLWLTAGIVVNVAFLGYFKYTDFFLSNVNALLSTNHDLLHLALPLGISFYTFAQIAYLVDTYKSEVYESSLIDYIIFITFFPRIIAGPIVHHKEIMPQFKNMRSKLLSYKNLSLGLFLFALGLVKKVLIADYFMEWADHGFNNAVALSFMEAWITSLSYTFQIYFDFSGYTDMALGTAMMFNIRLPMNFNSPYKALNIQDFWRRWHITLTRFLRDHIYIPLGGNRVGSYRIYMNFIIVFLIGGLWHGASWMFIIWGAFHGIGITVHRIWQQKGYKMNKALAWILTFNFINITWIFFRAKKWDDALHILKGMTGLQDIYFFVPRNNFLLFALMSILLLLLARNSNELAMKYKPVLKVQLAMAVLMTIGIINLTKISTFLYVNF